VILVQNSLHNHLNFRPCTMRNHLNFHSCIYYLVYAALANMVGKYFLKNVQQVYSTYKYYLQQCVLICCYSKGYTGFLAIEYVYRELQLSVTWRCIHKSREYLVNTLWIAIRQSRPLWLKIQNWQKNYGN